MKKKTTKRNATKAKKAKNKRRAKEEPVSTGHGAVKRRYISESIVKALTGGKSTKVTVKGKHGTQTKTLRSRNIKKDKKGHYFEYYDRSDTKKVALRDFQKDYKRHAKHGLNRKKGGYSGD